MLVTDRRARARIEDVCRAFENVQLHFDGHQVLARDGQVTFSVGEALLQFLELAVSLLKLLRSRPEFLRALGLLSGFRLERLGARHRLARSCFPLSLAVFGRLGRRRGRRFRLSRTGRSARRGKPEHREQAYQESFHGFEAVSILHGFSGVR
jgi:hypothetical protein